MIFIQTTATGHPSPCQMPTALYLCIKNKQNMKSYFTFLGRNKLYTAIQFFGLAIALGVVILLTSYADTEFNIGNNQSYSHQLYAVGYGDGIGMTTGTAPELFPSIPEIKEWTCLIHIEAADFMVDNQYYQVNGIAADPNFFQMLNYTLIGCDRNKALIGTDEVILLSLIHI